ncbi:hypothetical protein FUT84_00610 [Treponema phagedenis]|uniref:Uncharacterized protein n=1 Tax=Treponema phagedenis TaxID=162 RepID=A0AAE6IRU0_TREPH|nr:hypothetical protein FUT82_03175 [Treponema phagedenis]QEJ99826.1 hypothetical protein FUT84_00610 [Treponema phagedenis]QEK07243.1 hypothetical protein FUT80_11305 [Treponema phagedenis]QSH95565.1 hypothetical protein C5O78_11185 [Treponema phagedenis]
MVPRRSDVLKQGNLQSFKTRRFGFATDGKNSAPPWTAKSERAWTPVVPSRIEFENYHSYINRSFQTHRFGFDKDVKTKPSCRTLFKKQHLYSLH